MNIPKQIVSILYFGFPPGFLYRLKLQPENEGGCIPPHRKYLNKIVRVTILNRRPYVILDGKEYILRLISMDARNLENLSPLEENEMVILKDVHTWSEFKVVRLAEVMDN